jgi:hypothetical protein
MTHSWNNLHQHQRLLNYLAFQSHNQKIEKPNNLKVFGNKKAKGINQDSQNHLNIIYSYKYLESDLIKQSRDIYPFVGSTANRKVS